MRPPANSPAQAAVVDFAVSLVTAYLFSGEDVNQAEINSLLGETGDPELTAALASMVAHAVCVVAEITHRDPLVMWSEAMMERATHPEPSE